MPDVLVHADLLGYGREIIRGVIDYARIGRWRVLVSDWSGFTLYDPPANVAGVIALIRNQRMLEAAWKLPCPVVNVSALGPGLRFPSCVPDAAAVAAAAGEHLRARGYRHLACLLDATPYGQERERALRAWANKNGMPFSSASHGLGDAAVAAWLADLPRPAGLLADRTSRVHHLAASQEAWAIGPDIGLIGIGDDDLYAASMRPPQSTVVLPGEAIGHAAAARLDRLIGGVTDDHAPQRFAPLGVTARDSTRCLGAGDPLVARFRRLAEERFADNGMDVTRLCRALGVPRRTLVRHWAAHGEGTAVAFLEGLRMDHARVLLRDTTLTVAQVAQRCGYSSAEQFAVAFRRRNGVTPSGFRSAPSA